MSPMREGEKAVGSVPEDQYNGSLDKKEGASHVESYQRDDKDSEASFSGFDLAQQKKIMRRVDFRLLPILGVMYSISLIDRTNLGLALVAGMLDDLGLAVGNRYTILVMIFFVAYIIFEIPSNVVLTKVGAANWLAFLGASFGAILIGMGFTHTWGTMAVCRFLLGTVEAGFFPGCLFVITCWYTRYEVGKRLGAFWVTSVFATGFAAIFAYVLTLLDGKAGLAGWRWIFIIEGAITMAVCIGAWFIIVDFPTKATKFLTPAEQQFVINRINDDRSDAEEDAITARRVFYHLSDWRLWSWALNLTASTLPGYAYSYFLPVILQEGMGFTRAQSQLLSAPPYIFAALVTLFSSWLSDKYHLRGPLIAFHQVVTVAGMMITAYAKSNGARYFGAFLGVGAVQYVIPGVISFQANNITKYSKRAVASATCVTGAGIGGIIAGVSFKADESPHYTTGIFTTLGFAILSISLIIFMDLYFYRCNQKARAGERKNEGTEGFYYTY